MQKQLEARQSVMATVAEVIVCRQQFSIQGSRRVRAVGIELLARRWLIDIDQGCHSG